MRKDERRTVNRSRRWNLYILLPVVIGMTFPVYAPEASDNASVPARETKQKSATVAAREQTLSTLLVAAGKLRRANDTKKAIQTLNEAGHLQLNLFLKTEAVSTFQQSYDLLDQGADPITRVPSSRARSCMTAGCGLYFCKKSIRPVSIQPGMLPAVLLRYRSGAFFSYLLFVSPAVFFFC